MKKGQQSGLLPSMMMAVILIGVFTVLLGSYLQGLSDAYGTTYDNTTFSAFNRISSISSTINQSASKFVNDQGSQSTFTSIIDVAVSGAYGLFKIMFQIPAIFFSMTNAALNSMGIGTSGQVVADALFLIITAYILFKIVEYVMKVR